MKVSIIIPIYNAMEYLPIGMEKILNQTYSNIEILLVDNNSKDDSYNYIKETKVPIKDFTIEPDNIEMLVGEIVDVYITCIPELTTDANKIAIYNPSSQICTVKQIDVKNNIVHLTITANDNGNSEIEITGGSVLKKLNVVVNY